MGQYVKIVVRDPMGNPMVLTVEALSKEPIQEGSNGLPCHDAPPVMVLLGRRRVGWDVALDPG